MNWRQYLIVLLAACVVSPLTCWAETAAAAAKKPVVPPTPARLPDGKPNWTGFWVPVNGLLERDIGLGGTPAIPPGGGGAMKMPLRPFSQFSALKSPYKEQLENTSAAMKAGKLADPVALCFPPGMPRMMGMIYGMELLQTPGQIAITSEWQAASRRIWLNRSSHPAEDELDPSYAGDSIGHWQGDKLIVDTVGIRDDVPLNYEGLPHSNHLHIREVFSALSPGILQDEITIEDPEAFAAPWHEIETYRYRPDLSIREYVCLENNRNVAEDGSAKFDK
jgi:hypothetical protein